MSLLTTLTVKKFEFQKSEMADGGHLKTVELPYYVSSHSVEAGCKLLYSIYLLSITAVPVSVS